MIAVHVPQFESREEPSYKWKYVIRYIMAPRPSNEQCWPVVACLVRIVKREVTHLVQ